MKAESYEGGVAAMIAALLASVPRSARSGICSEAIARSRTDKIPKLLLPMIVPAGLADEQVYQIVRGIGQDVTALQLAKDEDQVGAVRAYSDALATSGPLLGDPIGGGAASTSWARAAATAALSLPETEPNAEWLTNLANEYDCARHIRPLGGGFGDWVNTQLGKAEKVLPEIGTLIANIRGTAASSAADRQKNDALTLIRGILPADQVWLAESAYANPTIATLANKGSSLTTEELAMLKQEIDRILSAVGVPDRDGLSDVVVPATIPDASSASAKASLDATRAALSSKLQQALLAKNNAEALTKESARIQWALAFLDAPDSVANMLASMDPSMGSVSSAVSSMAGLLASARDSGDITGRTSMTLAKKLLLGDPTESTDVSAIGEPALPKEL